MKKLVSIIAACLVMAMTVTAFSGITFAAESNEASNLRVLLAAEPESLDVGSGIFLATGTAGYPISSAMFMMLVYEDEPGNIQPGLVKEWEWIDGLHFRLKLRDDVYSAAGTNITANDLIYSWKRGAEGNSAASFVWFDFDNFVVEDDYTVVCAMTQSNPTMIENLAFCVYAVYSQADYEALEDVNAPAAVCTGRYKFKEWVPAQYIVLERNENYCDAATDAGYYDTITYTFNTDGSARALALQSNDCDITQEIDITQALSLESAGYNINYRDSADSMVLFMNCTQPPFDNENVRKAVAMCLDRRAISAVLYQGLATPIETPYTKASPYYMEYTGEPDYEAAKALLTEAGYPDGFTFTFNEEKSTLLAAQVIQANLAQIGITMEINDMDFAAYVHDRSAGTYTVNMGLANGSNVATILGFYDGRIPVQQAFGGAQYYGDDECNAMIDAVYVEEDKDEQIKKMNDLCTYLIDKGVMVGLCSVPKCFPCRPELEGMRFTTTAYMNVSEVHPAQ